MAIFRVLEMILEELQLVLPVFAVQFTCAAISCNIDKLQQGNIDILTSARRWHMGLTVLAVWKELRVDFVHGKKNSVGDEHWTVSDPTLEFFSVANIQPAHSKHCLVQRL